MRTVERLHRLVGGDVQVEEMILRFIAARYGAKNLFYLPTKVAEAVIERPWDFIRAAKNHCEPVAEPRALWQSTTDSDR